LRRRFGAAKVKRKSSEGTAKQTISTNINGTAKYNTLIFLRRRFGKAKVKRKSSEGTAKQIITTNIMARQNMRPEFFCGAVLGGTAQYW
jgi:hypothetical protein